jgi:hypothetical protein
MDIKLKLLNKQEQEQLEDKAPYDEPNDKSYDDESYDDDDYS